MRLGRSVARSLKALSSHRTRTLLAIASVGAGVAGVVLTSAIGTGVERDIRRNIESLGTNLLIVRPAAVKRFVARKAVIGTMTTLRLDDCLAIADLDRVAAVAPGIEGSAKVKAGTSTTTTRLLGTTDRFPAVRRFQVQRGRFFDADDDREARRVAVLGARVADALFEGTPAVGAGIRIRGVPFEVIGVLAPKGVVAEGDEDNQVLVPVRTALRRVFNVPWLNAVFVSVKDPEAMAGAAADIETALRQRHHARPGTAADFEVQNTARLYALQQQAGDTLDRLTTGLAALALGVGGTGILALMLLSVKERTGEIGLRMAVGATTQDILLQFLLEATVLAIGGWIGGLAVGAAGMAVIALATSWPVAVPAVAILGSFGMAIVIGIAFGAVPARNAARLPPVRALAAT